MSNLPPRSPPNGFFICIYRRQNNKKKKKQKNQRTNDKAERLHEQALGDDCPQGCLHGATKQRTHMEQICETTNR